MSVSVFFRKSRFDVLAGFFHQHLQVFIPFSGGLDRFVDSQLHPVPVEQLAGAWKNIERPVDGHRYDRKLELVGQEEGPFLELVHLAGKGTSSFRKYDQ